MAGVLDGSGRTARCIGVTSLPIVERYLAELGGVSPPGEGNANIVDEARDRLWRAVSA